MTHQHGRLLVVDDEREITHHLQLLFEGDSFLTYSAESANEALAIIDKNDIDILITDIRMPGMDGLELLARVKTMKPDIQCMVITGHGDMESAREAIKAGAIDFIPKPIHFEEVETAVAAGMVRRRLLLELQKRQQELEESNHKLRLARKEAEIANQAKTSFLANMSHEIRTPLNGVLGMAELLMESGLTAKQRHYCEMLRTSGKNLFCLLNDILDISKIEAGKLDLEIAPFNLRQIVADVMTEIAAIKRRKNISFKTHIHPTIPVYLSGDPLRFQQILLNLLSNAVKFTDQGEILTSIEVVQEDDQKIRLLCEVKDPGLGIAPEVVDHIFDPFTQADNSVTRKFGGTGLGLGIVQHLVAMMNGDVAVESKPGQGSTFIFTMQLEKTTMAAGTAPPAHQEYRPGGRLQLEDKNIARDGDEEQQLAFPDKRILLVEDNYINQQVSIEMLSLFNCQVDLAENGKEALRLIEKQQPYDLIFMDCHMPVLDGYSATKMIRELEKKIGPDQHVPIIAITARAIQGDCEKCLATGMDDYMSKPFTKKKLLAKLSAWLHTGKTDKPHTEVPPARTSAESLCLDSFMDLKILAHLRHREKNGRPILQTLINFFLEEAPRTFALLHEAIKAGDDKKCFFEAHRFKSSCLNMGIESMVTFCSELENASKKNDLRLATMGLAALKKEYDKVRPHLLQELDTLK